MGSFLRNGVALIGFLKNRVARIAFAIAAAFGLIEALVVGPPGMRFAGWCVAIVFVVLLVIAWFDDRRQRDWATRTRIEADRKRIEMAKASHLDDMKAFARRMYDRVMAGANAWETNEDYRRFKQHYPDVETIPNRLRLRNIFSGQGGGSCARCRELQDELDRLDPDRSAKGSLGRGQQ